MGGTLKEAGGKHPRLPIVLNYWTKPLVARKLAATSAADSPPTCTRPLSSCSVTRSSLANTGASRAAGEFTNSADAASFTTPPPAMYWPNSDIVERLLASDTSERMAMAQVLLAGAGASQTILLAS